MPISMDVGTYNLVCCRRDANNNFVYKREVNAFIEIPTEDRFVFSMMKNAGVPLIEWKDAKVAYALGEAAINIAYSMPSLQLKRPMFAGCLNPKEKHAQQIMAIMMHGLLDEVSQDKELLYYCVPSNAINSDTDAEYHNLILKEIFNSFKDDNGKTVVANPINEALALVYSELAKKAYTGLSVSAGGGMVNVCYSIFGVPAFQFAITNSGDWIDQQASKVTGESIAYINKEKNKLNLLEDSTDLVQRAIKAQYQIMIQKTAQEIKKGLESLGNKHKSHGAIDIVVSGGTSSPNGFEKLFGEALKAVNVPIEIGEIIKPTDTLYSVARGCLLAAEASVQ